MILKFIENIGNKGIIYFMRTIDFFSFVIKITLYMFHLQTYSKKSINLLVEQIYLSSIKILPLFIFIAFVLGSALIMISVVFAIHYNLQNQIGMLLVSFIFNEFAPLFTTIMIIFHYSLRINSRICFENNSCNLFTSIYSPKLIGALIAIPTMTLLFVTIVLVSGYGILSWYLHIDMITYKNMIIDSITIKNTLILLTKGIIFGAISIIIPLYYIDKIGNNETHRDEKIIKIIKSLFLTLFIIEVTSMVLVY